MYRPKPKAVIILEETFVLLKPDAAVKHGEIINEFRKAGFLVTSRQMATTRDNLKQICTQFADVAFAKAEAERAMNTSLTYTQGAGSFTGSNSAAFGSPAMRDRGGGSRKSSFSSQPSKNGGPGGGSPSLRDFLPSRDGSSPTASAWEALRLQHINHCLRGTCIALALSATNAVDEVLRMCGPDDPEIAKASAPDSLRAKYGTDSIRNAVYCAQTHQIAAALILDVFGYETQVRTEIADETPSGGGKVPDPAERLSAAAGADAIRSALYQPSSLIGAIEMQPTVPSRTMTTTQIFSELGEHPSVNQLAEAHAALTAERALLKREADLLRQREIDLLLREERFASRLVEAARLHGTAAVQHASDGMPVMKLSTGKTSTPHRPAPPSRQKEGPSAGAPRHSSPLRGTPVLASNQLEGHRGPGSATSQAHAARSIDHLLSVRPQQPSQYARHAAHLREVIPQKKKAATELRKEQRDLRRAVEMTSATDPVTESAAFVAAMWSAVRAEQHEQERTQRVRGNTTAGETPSPKNSVASMSAENSPRASTMPPGSFRASEAEAVVGSSIDLVFLNVFKHIAQTNSNNWNRRIAELEEEAQRAETTVDRLVEDLKVNEGKPQFTDEDAVVALRDLSTADLIAIAGSPGTITTLFLRFDGAKETKRMQKHDFMRFYETCAGFKDTVIVDDSRRIRDLLATKYSPRQTSITLDEFTALLLWLIRR